MRCIIVYTLWSSKTVQEQISPRHVSVKPSFVRCDFSWDNVVSFRLALIRDNLGFVSFQLGCIPAACISYRFISVTFPHSANFVSSRYRKLLKSNFPE